MQSFLDTPEFQSGLSAACRRVMESYGDAQSTYRSVADLEQDVRLRVLRWTPDFRGEASWRTVLRRIAKNAVIDAIRRDKGWPRDNAEVDWDNISIESLRVFAQAGPQADRLILLRQCFARLPADERQLFIDCYVRGQNHKHVAQRLKVSRQTIEQRLRAIRLKMKHCLGE